MEKYAFKEKINSTCTMQRRRKKAILFLRYIQKGEIVSRIRGECRDHPSEGRMTKSSSLSRVSYNVMGQEGKKMRFLSRYNLRYFIPDSLIYNFFSSEDYELAANLSNEAERKKLFTALKSAAESAWDFSSRHFRAKNGSNKGEPVYFYGICPHQSIRIQKN